MRLTAAMLALTLLLPALSFGEGQSGQTKKRQPLPKELRGTIPDFEVLAIDNETELNQNDLKAKAKKAGAKRIVLSFFASWCELCMAEFQLLKKNAGDLKKNGVQVYLIDVGESIHEFGDKVSGMVSKNAGNAFPFYFDPYANALENFGLVPSSGKYPLPLVIVMDSDLRVLGVLEEKAGNDFPRILWGNL